MDFLDYPLMPRTRDCSIPLTAFQTELWSTTAKGWTRLSRKLVVTSVRISGPLSTSLLRDSIDFLVQRHESLRTRIILVGGTPLQHIDTLHGCSLEIIDLTATGVSDVEGEAARLVHDFVGTITDLSEGPLLEAKLLKLSDREHILVIALDHMVSDGTSCRILNRELWTLYKQGTDGQPFSLPTLKIQFADYAVWQHQTHEAWIRNHAPYWKGRLGDARQLKFQSDSGVKNVKHSNAKVHFPLGKKVTSELRLIATREGTRLSSVVLAIYVFMMSRWLNQRDLVLAFISHGRHLHPELRNMVGFLANHMILRVDVDEQEGFVSLLNRVDHELHSAYQHYDFGRVLRLFPEQMSDLYFNWSSIDLTAVSVQARGTIQDQTSLRPFPIAAEWQLDFHPFFSESPAGIIATVVYRTNRFAKSTIDRFGHHLRIAATEFGRRPFSPMQTVPLP